MRRALGLAVFSGMLGVTFFGIVLTPVFFYVIDGLTDWRMFAHGALPRTGRFLLDVLRLGFIRRPAIRIYQRLTNRNPQPPAPGRPQPPHKTAPDSDTLPTAVPAGAEEPVS